MATLLIISQVHLDWGKEIQYHPCFIVMDILSKLLAKAMDRGILGFTMENG